MGYKNDTQGARRRVRRNVAGASENGGRDLRPIEVDIEKEDNSKDIASARIINSGNSEVNVNVNASAAAAAAAEDSEATAVAGAEELEEDSEDNGHGRKKW
ncbi:hypothetical protein [Guptibacillus sedimenti]|uniref:hypothetical protein n=1 Tax=Guptibacillus sedimenti TaxID=3025680 RepID=UPI0023603AEC|nr:hypothetical protein [Pseudalkalibacillus sedimenti]